MTSVYMYLQLTYVYMQLMCTYSDLCVHLATVYIQGVHVVYSCVHIANVLYICAVLYELIWQHKRLYIQMPIITLYINRSLDQICFGSCKAMIVNVNKIC